jgi:hypothetical protein
MEECLREHCGSPNAAKIDTVDVEVSGNHNSCLNRCNRLRFGPSRQRQCIEECDHEYTGGGKSGGKSSFSAPSGNGPSGRERDPEQCEAGCRRLRFSRRKQLDCIRNCHADEDEYEYDEEDAGMDDAERSIDAVDEKAQDALPGNDNACVSRCKRLRFSHERQLACIEGCNEEDESPDQKAGFDSEGDKNRGDSPANSNGQPNPCKARCMRLRFSAERQADCVSKCPTDEFYVRAS